MKLRWMVFASVILGNIMASQALAQEPLRYEMMQRHLVDQPAQLRIQAGETLRDIDVMITGCGKNVVREKYEALAAGQTQTLRWMQPAGRYQCNVKIRATVEAGTVAVNNVHEFVSLSPLQLSVDLRALTPDVSDIELHASSPFTTASIVVTADDGAEIDHVKKAFKRVKDAKISWTPNGKPPALLEIRIDDENGAWATNTVFYFQIPHTDIVFDTNADAIREDQNVYLRESLDKIQALLKTHERVAVDLYITGHTDTVGSAADNDRLSLRRARAIASWFRSHGLGIATYYRGAGERGLAVATPDETPNEKNRRAVYILSNRPPVDDVSLGGWTKL